MAEQVLTEISGRVGIITLNRPEALNAWTTEMREQLIEALISLDQDDAVRAIVLTGAGDRAFGAGQDLNQTMSFDAARAEVWIGEWKRLYNQLKGLSKPIIAALNGTAVGSAFQVALLCDMRIAHSAVRMGQPEINAGLPSSTGPWIMREIIGLARALEFTLTGDLVSADECYRIGLINKVVPQHQVLAASIELAEKLAAKPPLAMKLTRQRIWQMTDAGLDDALRAGVTMNRAAYASGEPARMMKEFFEKRALAKANKD